VVIHPPFWNTLLAKIIGLILLAMFAYWAYKYLSNLYEKRRTTEKIKFFINTTHDLRTPLTLISSPIYELKEKLVLDEWNNYLFGLVTTNLEKMNKMVSQLLDFQKSYESEEHLMVTKNNLNAVLTEKKMFWEPVAQRKNITLQLHLPENPLFEWYDKQKMDKILDNLISNAIKYSRNDGTVDIALTYTASHWQINVSDNGIGIPESAARKLFKRFYRAENAINSQETGSGLGLLLIKNYVSLHKGQTGVTSSENKGSDFFIRLKRGYKHYKNTELMDESDYSESNLETSDVENKNIDKQKTKLLIVEDNPDLREYIKMSLSHYFTTYTAENGKDAWEKIPTINPDIVLSDYNMPEMNGFELCEKIKKTYDTSHIPVILLTVMSDIKNMEEGYKLGADDYIPKPFDVKYLKLKIENIIANRKILRTKFLEINKPSELTETTDNEHNAAFLNKATKIMDDHIIDTDFSFSDFAREMGMSKSLLYTKFNAVTGYSPNDFVKITRMKKAVSLFKEGRYNINEVAAMTGFDEASYFTTSFKKIYGKSPKQFIKEDITNSGTTTE
jgi:CheY-like chemotaxis protein/AraC-like DNA-binding protein